jgi:hypothetical protein
MGVRSPIKRSTLADANERRYWRIYAEEGQELDLSNTVYALDSTTIDLCLSLSPCAPF